MGEELKALRAFAKAVDFKKRIEADRAADVPGQPGARCALERCICPTCGVTTLLLRTALIRRGVSQADSKRVAVRANDFRGAAHPYLASVRVDGMEVARIQHRPDEALAEDVLHDIERRLGC